MKERRVGIRELKSTLSQCVRDVKMGATIVVTEHGRSVARIVPQGHSLAERLETCKKGLNEAAAAVTRSGNLDAINDIETARKRLDKAIARIRHADRGYSGFFDPVKVDEAALARVYEFDLGLVGSVEEVVATGGDVKALIAKIDAVDVRLSDREAILAGIK